MTDKMEKDVKPDLERMVRIAIVDQLAHLGKYSLLTSVLVGVLIYAVFSGQINPLSLNLWILVLGVISVARILLILRFWRMDLVEQKLRYWIRNYLALSYLSAVCWGVLPLFDVFMVSEWGRTFIVFVVTGMSTGGVVTLFPLLHAAIPYILITLMPLLIVMARGGDTSFIFMAMMTGLYIVMLVRTTYILNRSMAQSIRLRIENKELFKFLNSFRDVEMSGKHKSDVGALNQGFSMGTFKQQPGGKQQWESTDAVN